MWSDDLVTGLKVGARGPWVVRREGREVMSREGGGVMRCGAVESWGPKGQSPVTARVPCAGSTGPLAFGEAAAPRGVDSAQRSVGDQAGSGVGGRGGVRAAREGCRVESRDSQAGAREGKPCVMCGRESYRNDEA